MEMNREYMDKLVIIRGERVMDINVLKDLDRILRDCLDSNDVSIVMDLSDTKFLDSIIAGKILAMLKLFRGHGGDIKLMSPQPYVLQTLRTLGVIGLLEVCENLDEIKKGFAEREIEKNELEFIKRQAIKKVLTRYDRLCTDITIEDRLQAAIDGRYVPNIERDLNIVDLFGEQKMILFDNIDEYCEHLEKYFTSRGLKTEHMSSMKGEIININDYCLRALNKEIKPEDLYKLFEISKFEAIDRKLAQLKKMIEE